MKFGKLNKYFGDKATLIADDLLDGGFENRLLYDCFSGFHWLFRMKLGNVIKC